MMRDGPAVSPIQSQTMPKRYIIIAGICVWLGDV
jgi:hypothetical protein